MKEQISKIEAADRQLRTALVLFLQGEDPVAIHTLVSASRNIYSDLSKSHNGTGFLKQLFEDLIRPERLKEFIKLFREPENFFKHADHDPSSAITFESDTNWFQILFAAKERQNLTKTVNAVGIYVFMYTACKMPDLTRDGWDKPFLDAGFDLTLLSRAPEASWLEAFYRTERSANSPKP